MPTMDELLRQHAHTRLNSLNLIVSENRMSPTASAPLGTDIATRYAADFYAGTGPAQEIIASATESARRVFGVRHANLSPISGNMSLLAVIFALTQPDEHVGRVPPFFPGGGYPLDYQVFHRQPLPLPFSDVDWQLDLDPTLALLDRKRPPLVVLGSSIVTYPMPVREVAEVVHSYGGIVAYDGSHCLGLIAGGNYQDPLGEGADILLGSTHKTFPGPQGGIVLTNDDELNDRINVVSNFTPLNGPTLICNPHLDRIAATGIVLEETPWKEYSNQVVANARSLAGTLKADGVPLRGAGAANFPELTYCHQVVTGYEKPDWRRLRDRLAEHRINVDGFLRMGVSEITRLGFTEDDTAELAHIIAALLGEQEPVDKLDRRLDEMIETHREVVL